VKFNVPIVKGNDFPMLLFGLLSNQIQQLATEHEKWPNKVTFLGQIGKEILDIIEEKKWDFDKFNLTHEQTSVNKIIIEYTKPLDQIEDMGYAKGDSLHGQTMKGLPGDETISKLKNHSLNMSFQIERKIRPKLEIKLIR
jgi:hypothetical protein